jgi:hypothetical protein
VPLVVAPPPPAPAAPPLVAVVTVVAPPPLLTLEPPLAPVVTLEAPPAELPVDVATLEPAPGSCDGSVEHEAWTTAPSKAIGPRRRASITKGPSFRRCPAYRDAIAKKTGILALGSSIDRDRCVCA